MKDNEPSMSCRDKIRTFFGSVVLLKAIRDNCFVKGSLSLLALAIVLPLVSCTSTNSRQITDLGQRVKTLEEAKVDHDLWDHELKDLEEMTDNAFDNFDRLGKDCKALATGINARFTLMDQVLERSKKGSLGQAMYKERIDNHKEQTRGVFADTLDCPISLLSN